MMRMNKFFLALFGAALLGCSVLSSCSKSDDDDLNDLAEQEEQVEQDSQKNANG